MSGSIHSGGADESPIIHDPVNKMPIDKLWVWLSVDDQGNEGIMATGHTDSDGKVSAVPMLTGKWEYVPELQRIADATAKFTKKKIVRAEFVRNRGADR